MKKLLLAVFFLASPAIAQSPVFQWVLTKSVHFKFSTTRVIEIPLEYQYEKLRFVVSADSPVKIFVFSAHPAQRDVKTCDDFEYETSIIVECEVPAMPQMRVTDERFRQLLPAVIAGRQALADAVNNSMDANKVKIDLYEWQCIENCDPHKKRKHRHS